MLTLEESNKTDNYSVIDRSDTYLVFELADRQYAMQVDHIREVMTHCCPTPVPGAPEQLLGMLSVSTGTMPAIDLRKKLGMEHVPVNSRDRFVILKTAELGNWPFVAVRVDNVLEVTRIPPDAIDVPPSTEERSDQLNIRGVAQTHSGVKLVLNDAQVMEQMAKAVQE